MKAIRRVLLILSCCSVSIAATSTALATTPDPVKLLAPPPARGSAIDLADLAEVRARQATRTAAECARAASEAAVTLSGFFGGALAPDQAKRFEPLFEDVRARTDALVQPAKAHWGRPRPYLAAADLTPCVPRESTAAYPSGHAAIARAFARVMARANPAGASAYLARADQIASDRVLGGVHHPSDIAAGKLLGDAVAHALLADPDFVRRLRATDP